MCIRDRWGAAPAPADRPQLAARQVARRGGGDPRRWCAALRRLDGDTRTQSRAVVRRSRANRGSGRGAMALGCVQLCTALYARVYARVRLCTAERARPIVTRKSNEMR
eukprot:838315-Prorocentrum_minimum.AAC.1